MKDFLSYDLMAFYKFLILERMILIVFFFSCWHLMCINNRFGVVDMSFFWIYDFSFLMIRLSFLLV